MPMHGIIENETGLSFQAVVKLSPVERHYEAQGEAPYIKYGCPVCDEIGLKHQVHSCNAQCPNCGVNLLWK